MAKREWIGNYQLRFDQYFSYKDEYVTKTVDLGKCLGNGEAFTKAVAYLVRENVDADPASMVVIDGWGNEFKA